MASINTMKAWPKKIDSFEEIPAAFQETTEPVLAEKEVFPLTVFVPAMEFAIQKTNEKIMSMLGKRIYIWENLEEEVKEVWYPFETIQYIESGSILLHSWLEINAMIDDKPSTSLIEYHTIEEELFHSMIDEIRKYNGKFEDDSIEEELEKLDFLKPLSLKMINYAKAALLPGQKIINVSFQPAIQEKYLFFFNRMILGEGLIILTDKEVIIIQEKLSNSRFRNDKYGGVWRYIPLSHIRDLTLKEEPSNPELKEISALTIELKNNKVFEIPYENQAKIETFLRDFQGMKSH